MSVERVRDLALLIGGLFLLGYEVIAVAEPRLVVLGIAAAMLGLPAYAVAGNRFQITRTPPPDKPRDEVSP